MKNQVFFMGAVFLGAGFGAFCDPAGAIEVVEPAYMLETYISFECPSNRPAQEMAFDPDGNIFVTIYINWEGRDGRIYRIDKDRNLTEWITGLSSPMGIIWAGGTDYGEYLYVNEAYRTTTWSEGGVTRISLDGIKTPFSGPGLNYPAVLEIDRTGNYGGYMYVGNSVRDNIEKVMPGGQVQSFSGYPYNVSGSPGGIVFDTDGRYGGLMYVTVFTNTQSPWRGISSLDTGGNPTRFAPEIIYARHLAFDTTENQYFGGYLYVAGYTEADPSWSI